MELITHLVKYGNVFVLQFRIQFQKVLVLIIIFLFNSFLSFNKAKDMLANAVPACLFVVLCLFSSFRICNIHAQNPFYFCCKLIGEKRKQISQASLLCGLALMQQFFFFSTSKTTSFFFMWCEWLLCFGLHNKAF